MNEDRDRIIIRTSVIGIIANVALVVFKAFVGIASHSVAIVLDAVNNLTDALSSIITIVGTRLAAKKPDRDHPFGHGRVEYLSTAIISVIVLYAGLTSMVESVRGILNPQEPDYQPVTLIIVGVAVVVKIVLGLYVRRVGKTVSSDSLVASGTDALFDSIISASTLVAAVLYLIFGIKLEAWLGVAISAVIIKSGYEMLRDTVSEILGSRVDADIAVKVREVALSFPEVLGVYDLIIHNYGPTALIGSMHITVPDTMTAVELDRLEREITQMIYLQTNVVMGGISVYADNSSDEEVHAMEVAVRKAISSRPGVLQIHGFFVDRKEKLVRFDVVLDFKVEDMRAEMAEIRSIAEELCPGYRIYATLDYDFTD